MMNNEINNPFMGDEGLDLNMPPQPLAWQDMRRRLDDEMPVAGLPLPGSIINVDNGFLRGITSLFALLLISSAALLFSNTALHFLKPFNDNTAVNANKQLPAKKDNKEQEELNDDASKSQSPIPQPVTKQGNTRAAGKKAIAINSQNKFSVTQGKKATIAANPQTQLKIGSSASTPETAYNNIQPVTQTQSFIANKKDTATHKVAVGNNNPAAADSIEQNKPNEEEDKQWQAGLTWKLQVPFSSTQQYFAGPNAASQPYRVLLPGVWVSMKVDKQLFDLELNPFSSTVYNPKPFVLYTRQVGAQTIVTETKRINKLFGVSVAAGYSYNIKGSWWLGGQLQARVLTKGVVTNDKEASTNGTITRSQTIEVINDTDWQYVNHLQVRTAAQVFYTAKKWQAGVRAGIYFTPLTKSYGNGTNPLEVEVYYKLELWNKKTK